MLNEIKILFNNLKNLRRLNEGVGENDIKDAIHNREYIYIYYTGDETTAAGSRTVRPMVLGKYTPKGKKNEEPQTHTYLRAWEDRGKSWHFNNQKRGEEHDYWNDMNYNIKKNLPNPKPGWRMFRLDKIQSVLPTGLHFIDDDGNVMIPPKYNMGGDANMDSIIAYVDNKTPDAFIQRIGKPDQPNVTAVPATGRWKDFATANKERNQIGANEVKKLWNLARLMHKKSVRDFFVAVDDRNEYHLKSKKIEDRFPENAIVGDLVDLYNYFFNQQKTYDQQDQDFARKELDKLDKEIGDEENQGI